MGKIKLANIKNEIKKSGTSKGKFLFFKEDSKVRVRFLTDMEDGLEVSFHDSFQLGINVPCQEVFGRDCEYCENEDLRTRNMYVWSVYDYESKEVKLLMAAVNNCSPVPALASLYESYGTLCDRDYEIKRIGKGQNTTYSVIPLEKMKFRNTKVKPMSEQAMLKCIDKAYPADNSEDFEDEDEAPKRNKNKGAKSNNKPLKGKMNEPEDDNDDWDDEEEEQDYESMTAKELFQLCKDRDIECKPKKTKEYYIDLLEEADEEDSDDWDDEDSDDDWED
jgi:hypothetical protein